LSPPDFSITAAPSSQSITVGDSASYLAYVSPQPGFSGFLSLSCSGLPTGAACSPVTLSVPATGGQVSTPLTVNTGPSTANGTFNFTITANFGSLVHTTTASLTITAAAPPSFSITATPLSPTSIKAGNSATSTVTIMPSGGFNSTVNLTCAITPVTTLPPTCTFGSPTVNGGSGTQTVTVSTTAAVAFAPSNRTTNIYYAMLWPFFGLTLVTASSGRARRTLLGRLLPVMIISLILLLPSCGGGPSHSDGSSESNHSKPGTTAGVYTVTITGTAGSLTKTSTLSLTVE